MPLTSPASAQTPVLTTRGAMQTYGVRPKLEVLVKDLEVGDVVFQHSTVGGKQGSIYTYLEVIKAPVYVGGFSNLQLTVKNLDCGEVSEVKWGNISYSRVIASAKLAALAKNPALARLPRPGALPMWRGTAVVR